MKAMRQILGILLAVLLLMTAGCGSADETQSGAIPDAAATPNVTQSAESTGTELEEDALHVLRQSMEGTTQLFAVAYFGYYDPVDYNQPEEASAIMAELAPKLCEEFPFLLEIPEENVIGQWGELYCIVPLDSDATVAVNKGYWDYENYQNVYDDMLYSSDSGEPIVLFCNNAGWEPDTQLYISGPSGEVFWYPQTDVNGYAAPLQDDNWDDLILDFSAYGELLAGKYESLSAEGWTAPSYEMLVGTTWCDATYLKDYREVVYEVSFQEDTLSVRWNDGIDEEDHTYPDAAWELTYEDGFAVLSVDFREMAGVLRYNLLYNEESQSLYFALDATQQDMPIGWEPLSRVLNDVPDPMDMVGTWLLDWTEFEGETIVAEPYTQILTISHNHDGLYWVDYTNYDNPDSCYNGKELAVIHESLYYECGNDSWIANVNYVGANGVEHRLTLLPDGTLVLQNYWELDGAPTVSYGYYYKLS